MQLLLLWLLYVRAVRVVRVVRVGNGVMCDRAVMVVRGVCVGMVVIGVGRVVRFGIFGFAVLAVGVVLAYMGVTVVVVCICMVVCGVRGLWLCVWSSVLCMVLPVARLVMLSCHAVPIAM